MKQSSTVCLLFCRTIECRGYVLRRKHDANGPQTQRCEICAKRRKEMLRKTRNSINKRKSMERKYKTKLKEIKTLLDVILDYERRYPENIMSNTYNSKSRRKILVL